MDNYGDIGVSWRLARQLTDEQLAVRLWLDDLPSLQRLCPELDTGQEAQSCQGVEIRHWTKDFPEVRPADLVIEAFACELPESYIQAMAARAQKSVWVNLEYLSAEDWVEGCHKLPSPRPNLPLVKYFFFPGFTPRTGGLLVERDLLARRDAFLNDQAAIDGFWRKAQLPPPKPEELRISLFGYENPAIPELLHTWENGGQPVTCLVPEGRSLPQVAGYFGVSEAKAMDGWQRGNLRVRVLPFMAQKDFDTLLWACDINFVRGEDSFVRAQLSGNPLIWHIYPQHDGVHMKKMGAFLDKYCAGLPPEAAHATTTLWEGWNGGTWEHERNVARTWNEFAACQSILADHAHNWALALSENSLTLNLLDFFQEIDKIDDFGNSAG